MKKNALLLLLFAAVLRASGQDFNEKWVVPLEFSQGFSKAPSSPELYIGQLSVSPQFKLVDKRLRAGITVGGFITSGQVYGVGGPRLALKIAKLGKIFTADAGNLHLSADYLSGTHKQQLLGGGFHADLAELLILSLNYRRDLHYRANWFQVGIAYHLYREKIPATIQSNPTDVR
ncbi:hypothetical protein GCM10028803_60630 [Larkinella knui]|uniref:Outer membrane protein beta-barrel domain-containing protein n=1 Tax=Larkinella knui TaxID=2025310 RepID=A0A3P1CAP1_9BACT|nr:hypothetical protein [Larkinella knui]RRB10401.1 hypothetical protein EHT87_29705 [Larkinella knui]